MYAIRSYYELVLADAEPPPEMIRQALRKRSEDIPLIAQHFLECYAEENDKPIREISSRAMELSYNFV